MKFIFWMTWTTEIWLWSHVHCQKSLNWAGMSSAKVCIFQPRVYLQVWRENTGVKFWRRGATAATCNCPFCCWTPWISQHIQIVCRLEIPSIFHASKYLSYTTTKKVQQIKGWFLEPPGLLKNCQNHGWWREFRRTPAEQSRRWVGSNPTNDASPLPMLSLPK